MKPTVTPLNAESCTPEWVVGELQSRVKDIGSIFVIGICKDNKIMVMSSAMSIGEQFILVRLAQAALDGQILGGAR